MSTNVYVAADGTGDYLTIQEGSDAVDPNGLVNVKGNLDYAITSPILVDGKKVTWKAINGIVHVIQSNSVHGFYARNGAHLILEGEWLLEGNGIESWISTGIRGEGARIDIMAHVICRNWGTLGMDLQDSTSQSPGTIEARNCHKHGVGLNGCDQGGHINRIIATENKMEGVVLIGTPMTGTKITRNWLIRYVESYRNGEKGLYIDQGSTHNTFLNLKIYENGVPPYYTGGWSEGIAIKDDHNIFGAILDVDGNFLELGIIEIYGHDGNGFAFSGYPAGNTEGAEVRGAAYNKIFFINSHHNGSNYVINGPDAKCHDNEIGWCKGNDAHKTGTWGGYGFYIAPPDYSNNIHDCEFLRNDLDILLYGHDNKVKRCMYETLDDSGSGNEVDSPTQPNPPPTPKPNLINMLPVSVALTGGTVLILASTLKD